jgi:hypothetical protein
MDPSVQFPVLVPTETMPPGLPTALHRPPAKQIRSFRPSMIGDDTIATLLENGWSLGVCCRNCPRVVEWKPEWIEERFGDQPNLKLAHLQPRLQCDETAGCGARDMVIFPYREKAPPKRKAEGPRNGELPF